MGFPEVPDEIIYNDLIATTIQITVLPEGKTVDDLVDGDRVGFNEMEGNDSSKVCFLKDIKQEPGDIRVSHRSYMATYVSPKSAGELARKGYGDGSDSHPIFHVHGFNNEPNWTLGVTMMRAMENCKKTKKNYPIPVIWPNHGNNFPGYAIDSNYNAMRAGRNLKALVDTIPNDIFPVKSIMCHSMGNHVVFDGALGGPKPPDVKFKNIFLAGADIPCTIFGPDPPNGKFPNKYQKASNMKATLMEGGKIFVLCNANDTRLRASKISNFGERLGRYGPDVVREDLKDTVVIVDTTPFSEAETEEEHFDPNMHSYHWEAWAVDVYDHPEKYADRHDILPHPGLLWSIWEIIKGQFP